MTISSFMKPLTSRKARVRRITFDCGCYACLLMVVAVSASGAEDWPLARGNALGTAVARTVLPAEPELLWKYVAKESGWEATPVVSRGVVYVGDADGTFHAVRLTNGTPLWKKTFDDTGFAAGAAVRGDRLFVGDIYGDVRCLATTSGDVLWTFKTESEVFAAPNLHEDAVLVTTESGQLFSLDAETGEERWRFTIEAPLRCSPTIIDGHTMLAGCDEQLHAINLSNGQEVGTVSIAGPTGSTPAIANRRSYFGTESGVFQAVDAADPTCFDGRLVLPRSTPWSGHPQRCRP